MATAQAAYGDAPSAARETGVALVGLVVGVLVGYGLWAGFHLDNLHNGLLALTFTAVGLYVVRMRPGHRVGRLFAAVGVLQAVLFFGRQYARHEPRVAGRRLAGVGRGVAGAPCDRDRRSGRDGVPRRPDAVAAMADGGRRDGRPRNPALGGLGALADRG
ncbi:MAG: hypothetical protein WKF73_18335 [Nocardioidaceae bacterium]